MSANNKSKLQIVPQYIKNVTRSVKYASSEIIGEIMPNAASFAQTNTEVFKTLTTDIRNYKSVIRRTQQQVASSNYTDSAKKLIKNFAEDVKSGNYYNKARESKAILSATGWDSVLDTSDFNFDFDDVADNADFDNSESPLTDGEKVQTQTQLLTANTIQQGAASTLHAIKESTNMSVDATIQTSKYLAENQSALNTTNMVFHQKMFNELNSGVLDIATNIRGIFDFTNNIGQYFNDTAKLTETMTNKITELEALNREFTEMQRNMYKEYTADSNREAPKSKNSFISGGLDIKEYVDSVMTKAKNEFKNSQVGSMMGAMGDDTNFIEAFSGSPAKFIAKTIGGKLFPKNLKKSMSNLDDIFKNFTQSGLLKFSSAMKEKGESNELFNTIYKIFGLDLGGKVSTSTSGYIKGPVPFSGYDHKAITDVIPTYLRKILATMTGGKEMIYDYSRGKFLTETDVKSNFDFETKMSYGGLDSTRNEVDNKLDKLLLRDEDKKKLDKSVDELFNLIIDRGLFYNPKDMDIDKLHNMGMYNISPEEFKLINSALKTLDPKKLMQMSKDTISAVEYRRDSNATINKELTEKGFSGLNELNGFNADNSASRPLGLLATDVYNKTIFDYLRDIRTVLVTGVKTFNVPNIGAKLKRSSKIVPDSQAESLYKTFKNEVATQMNNTPTNNQNQKTDEELAQEAKDGDKKFISNMSNIGGMQDDDIMSLFSDPEKASTDARTNSAAYQFLSKFKIFNDINSAKGKFAGVAKNVASAPELLLINLFDTVSDNLVYLLYGTKNTDGKSVMDRITDKVNTLTENTYTWVRENVIDPLKEALNGENGIIPKFKEKIAPLVEKIKNSSFDAIGKFSNRIFGDDEKSMSPKEFYNKHLKSRMGKLGIGAGIGALLGLATPLGLLGTTVLGSGIGLASTSETVKNRLFGEIGTDGERKGGYIPKSVLKEFKGATKPMGIGAGIGALAGLITPLGLFGSTLFGGAIGMVSNMSSVKDILFGKMGADGNRDKTHAIIQGAWADKLKSNGLNLAKGAGLGILGSFFLPGGPIGGALFGMAASMGIQTETFKKFLFGKYDPTTDGRHGGLLDKVKVFFKTEIGDPLKIAVKTVLAKGSNFIKTNMINPFLDSMAPLKKQFGIFKEGLKDMMKTGWSSLTEHIGGMFEKEVGQPLGEVINKNLVDPLKKFFNTLFSGIGKMVGGILSAPFKLLNGKANGYMAEHEAAGEADYKIERNKAKKERDTKTAEALSKQMKDINKLKEENKFAKDILEDNHFSNDAFSRVQGVYDAKAGFGTDNTEYDTETGLLKNSEKTATLLDNAKTILSDTKDILADSFKDITEKIKDSMDIQTESKGSLDNLCQIGKSIFSSLKGSIGDTITGQISGQTNLFDGVDKEIDTHLIKGTLNKFKESSNGILGKILPKVEKPLDDQTSFFDKIDGSHANGLANVPKDGYIAELHKNEMVVPANKADAVRNIIKNGANNSLLNKIYEKVNGIFTIINQKNNLPNNKNKANPLVDIKNNTKDIFKELDGQITNVGYNTEYIANILTDVFGPPSMLPKGVRAGVHKIKSIFSKVFGFITKPFKWIGEKFSWITDKFKSVANIVDNAINKIIEIPKAILEFGKSLVHDAIGVVSGLAKTAFGAIKGIFSMVPDMFHTASEFLINSFKVLGEAGIQLFKGLGSVAVQTIGALGEMGKGFIKLGATVIPEFIGGMVKATKSIAGLITGALSSAWNFIKKPFSKKGNKTISNIKHVDEVGIVREITLLNKVKSVGILEKIGDTRLYSKLDAIINGTKKSSNNDESTNPLVDSVKNSMNHVVASSKKLAESIRDSFDTKLDNRNKQVAEFNADEKAETEKRKKSQSEKLQSAANQSQVEMNERSKSSFSGKGIFGILSKALLFIAPGMMAKLAAIKSGGGFIKYFGSKLWMTLKNSAILKSIGKWVSTKITSIGKWVTSKVLPKMALKSATTKATTSAATTVAASGATAAAASKVAGKTGTAVAAGTAAGAASSGKLSKTLTKVAGKARGKGKIIAGAAAGLTALYAGKKIYDSDNVGEVSYDSDGNAIIDENAYDNNQSLAASIGEAGVRSHMNKSAMNAVRTKASSKVASAGLNATLLKNTETVADSGLVKKILTSSAVKKLAGKLGPFLSKLSEKLAPKLAKAGAGFFAKLTTKWSLVIGSAGASGGIIPAIWYGGNLVNDISKTNQMFEVPADFKATPLMQLIAGFAGFVTDNITFGLLPSSLICEWLGSWALSEEELQKISDAKTTLQNNYQNYVNTTGKNITFDAYNETVENQSAFRKTTSRLIQVNTGGVFNNDEISKRTGKSEDDITFTDRIKNLGINTKDKFTLNQFNEDEMRKLLGKTNGEAITIADRANVGFGSLVESLTLGAVSDENMVKFVGITQKGVTDAVSGAKDWVTNGFNNMDTELGTFFGCTDEDGNSIKVSEVVATTWDNLKDANSKVIASIKENAGTIWDGTKDFFGKAVDNYKGAYKWTDDMIGAVFNLTDDEGNPLSLTQATKKAAINTFENVKSVAGNVWSGITGTVTKWKDNIVKATDVTDATLGAIFHLEDDEGNPLSFTEWIVSPDGLVDDATRGIKKIASGLWNDVSNWVSDTIKGFTNFAVKKDTELGLLLGCTDEDGNPITFTQGVKRAIGIENSMIAKNVKGFAQNAYKLWDNTNTWFVDKLTNFAEFGKSKDSELGAYFGCVDENGNSLSFTGYATMAKDNLMNKISSLPTSVRQISSQVWGDISNFFNEIKDSISSAINFTNLKLGGMLGLEDDTGNTIGLTDWVKTKKNAITNKVSSTASGIGSWTKGKLNITDSDITDRLSTDSAGNGKGWITFPSRYGTKNNKSAGNGPATAEDNYNGAVYYRQGDDRWGQMDYGTGSIAASGCGPTSAAMLISSLTGQPITPDETAAWSVANGYRIPNEGTSFDFFPAVAKQYGLELTPTEDYTGSLMDSLRSGYPAILSGAGPAPFTNGGHLLFAVGADPNNSNNVIINDPVNKDRSTSYPISDLSGSMMQAWVANKKLSGGVTVSGSSGNNTTNTTTKEKDTSPFLTAISQLGALTSGYIQSAVSGTAFDANAILNTDSTTATNSTGGYTFSGGVLTPPAGMQVGTSSIDAVAPYMSKFASAGNQYGIDPAVIAAIAMQESGGDANLQEAAWGLMQIENGDTTDEFIDFGKSKYGEDWSSDDRLNPDKAIPFAANRLSSDLSHYNGDYIKTIQAYNFSKYSLDKLIGAFGDDWLSHTGEMAYYNGHYDSTGSTSYGDPQYVPHVLRYYHNNASAGNGFGDSSKFIKLNNKYIKSKATNNNINTPKFDATDFLLNNTSKISDTVNGYVSTRDILINSNKYDGDKLNKIIEILSTIADNTKDTADTNAELVNKEYNPNIIVNSKNSNNETSTDINTNNKQSPTLGNISNRGASKQIDDAYSKAIMIAKGRYE